MADGHSFFVDRTGILLFASALGETNPIYYDDAHARSTPLGGVIAPPTFAVSSAHWNPDYGLKGVRRIPAPAPKPATPPAEGKPKGGGGLNLARVLHGEQRFDYQQPLRPGMKLTVTTRAGKAWSKEGKRGGVMHFTESIAEYRDENGDLVVVATSVGILTEKAVGD